MELDHENNNASLSSYYYSSSSQSPSSSHSQQLSPNLEHSSPRNSSSSPSSHHALVPKKKAGRKKFRETRHPIYRGVRQRNGDRWVCEVREPNKKTRIWLGTYPTPEMAARAYDAAVLALRGTSAIFNFPHSVSLLPIARSSSPADIRAAAAKAAEANPSDSSYSVSTSISTTFTSNNTSSKPCVVDNNNTSAKKKIEIGNGVDVDVDDEYSKSMFFDEEALYNMPGLLDSMAEGLLITPPSMKQAFDWDNIEEFETDFNLWTL